MLQDVSGNAAFLAFTPFGFVVLQGNKRVFTSLNGEYLHFKTGLFTPHQLGRAVVPMSFVCEWARSSGSEPSPKPCVHDGNW